MITPKFLIVDLFCGAGGTTTGFEKTNGVAKVIAAINHDKNAIKSHWENHPDVKHFEEDIRTLKLEPLIELVDNYRKKFPSAKVILWASLECTNFSRAKGGKPRDADSRTLADHLFRYIHALNPEITQIENVVEFMAWGPLDKTGKPISNKNGSEWLRWRKEMCNAGNYCDDWRELNSADFGAYTSRNRLFGFFSKQKQFIVWPEPTHFKKLSSGNLFITGKKWNPVKYVLDLDDEGSSIFTRTKRLSEKTLERIYAGLIKYIALGDTSFIAKYYGHGNNIQSIDSPAGTITTKDRLSKIQPIWIDRNFSNGGGVNSIENPAGSVLSVPKLNLIHVKKFIMNTAFNNIGSDLENPAPTLTASRRHHYLINPQWGGNPGSIDKPCFTLIARMDKAPPYIVSLHNQNESFTINVDGFFNDCDYQYINDICNQIYGPLLYKSASIKIVEFMAIYGIVDIKMRMLNIPELLRIQGFPDNYKLIGTQTEQKKYIGNSVHPLIPEKWINAISQKNIN